MRNIGVALVTYNRPEHTARVLDKLKYIQPLYIFSDGPKEEKDASLVNEVRDLITGLSWGNPQLIAHKENWGLADSVVNAVDFVLRRHEMVILLEDDCLPGPYFFDFIYDCLAKYEDDERIFGVTGYTVPIDLREYPYDAYFFPRIGSWGWATWRSRWEHYRRNLAKAHWEASDKGIDLKQGGQDIPGLIQAVLTGELNAWTMGWQIAMRLSGGMYVYPTVSHIENIGMDGTGIHTGKTDRWNTPIATERAVKFPDDVILDQRVLRIYEGYFGPPNKTLSLDGEREIERAFAADRLPFGKGKVLDLGPDGLGQISSLATERGYTVTAIGLEERKVQSWTHEQGDFLEIQIEDRFDVALAISTIEHFGLAGRYGIKDDNVNADLEGMKKLQSILKPDGILLLTIPVGQDATLSPWHRIYGRKRLPLLLDGYHVIEEKYWAKDRDVYVQVDRETALNVYPCRGPHFYYALGQFTLVVDHPKPELKLTGLKATEASLYYCTFCDRKYLPKFLALHESMEEHCQPYKLWILAIDEMTEMILGKMDLLNVTVIGMTDFVDHAVLTSDRRWDEFLWGITPSWILFVLRNAPGIEAAIYLDADSCFFGRPKPVLEELDMTSVGIVPHRFAPEHTKNFIYGIYNVNGVYVRKDSIGLACMRKWRHQCNEWCYRRFEEGKFCDQKYLMSWPVEFGAHVIEHIGWNLAPWNQNQYDYSPRGKEIYADEKPVILYHFHALMIEDETARDFNLSPYSLAVPVKNYIYGTYTERVSRAISSISDIPGTQLVIPKRRLPEQTILQLPVLENFADWIEAIGHRQTDGLTAKHLQSLFDLVKEHRPDIIVDIVSGCGLSLRTWLATGIEIVAIGERMDEIYESWRSLPIDLARMRWAKKAIKDVDFTALWEEDKKVLFYFTLHDARTAQYLLLNVVRNLPKGSIVIINDIQHNLIEELDTQHEILQSDGLVVLKT